MRTAKKTLCLVLVFAMMLSLCVFASADVTKVEDYTDYADIPAQYKQATTILTAIEVFNGYAENDAFQGTEKLTRAQGAKIIAVMLGFKDSMTAAKASNFTDMGEAEWAIPYVNAGVERGIIAGYGDGRFGPNDPLTGTQFAKMLLTALGYDAEKQGLIGSGWDVNTAILANNADSRLIPSESVYGAFPYTENIDRFTAAQMSYNTLLLPLVRYAGNNTAWDFETSSARASQTISSRVTNGGLYMVEFAERYFPTLVRSTVANDDFGAPATKWKFNNNEIASNVLEPIFEDSDSATLGDIYDAYVKYYLGDSTGAINSLVDIWVDGVKVIAVNGNNVDLDEDLSVEDTIKYAAIAAAIQQSDGNLINKRAAFVGRGTLVQMFLDEDLYSNNAGYNAGQAVNRTPKVTIVVKHTWLGEAASDVKDSKADIVVFDAATTKRTGTLYEDVDVSNISDLKDGETVRVTIAGNSIKTVDRADDDINVTVNSYTSDNGWMNSIKMNGETTQVAEMALYNSDILSNYTLEQLLHYTYDVYYDQYGYVLGIEFNQKDTDYVFVAGIDVVSNVLGSTSYKASVIWTDGKFEVINVAAKGSAKEFIGGDDDQTLNTWFVCSKDDSGNVTLRDVVGNGTGDVQQAAVQKSDGEPTPDISTSKKSLSIGASSVEGNDASVYIMAKADDSVVTGEDPNKLVGAITGASGAVKGIKNVSVNVLDLADEGLNAFADGYEDTFFIYNAKTKYVLYCVTVAESVADNLVYITKTVKERSYVDGVGYVDTYEAIAEGEKVEELKVISDKTDTVTNKLQEQNMYFVSYDEKDEYVVFVSEAALDETDMADFNEDDLRNAGYALKRGLSWDENNCVTLEDNTLWISSEGEGAAITIADDCKFFVGAFDADDNDDYKAYNTAERAIVAATKDNHAIIGLYVDINSKGWAETVVFIYGAVEAAGLQLVAPAEGWIYGEPEIAFAEAQADDNIVYEVAADGTYYIISDTDTVIISITGPENADGDLAYYFSASQGENVEYLDRTSVKVTLEEGKTISVKFIVNPNYVPDEEE